LMSRAGGKKVIIKEKPVLVHIIKGKARKEQKGEEGFWMASPGREREEEGREITCV